MSGTRRGLTLLAILVAMMAGWVSTATAQVTTTTVQDTVYGANGTPATGTVLVSWNAFTTAGGQSVPAGATAVTIGTGGSLTVALAPNAGSTPMGTYYTAVFHLSDGTSSRQYWVVPATVPGGATTVTMAEIKSEVLPISVAMQTVSKEYVDDAIAAASTGFPLDSSPYVLTAGDSMTGPLTLPADPVNTNQAADKHYVDTNVAAAEAGVAQKVSLLPTATQLIAQPSGTSFAIAGTNATTTFAGGGTSTSMTYTAPVATPQMLSNNLYLFGQGYDLGNNGTSAQGWTSGHLNTSYFGSAVRGIMQGYSTTFTHTGQGDTAAWYDYLDAYGGKVAASDEGVEDTVHQVHQIGYFTGTIATGGTAGSNLLTTSSFACHGYCATQATFQFPDGGMMLDTTKGGTVTATIAGEKHDATNYAMYYTLGSGTVPVSTAWGSIVSSSCTPNGNGQNQVYTSTTCNITLGTSPASPGSFVAGTDICLAGPFQEEAAVTAVGTTSAGVQPVTFSTRYAWNWYQPPFVMQGGVCGQAFTANPSWPIAYQALGATAPTTLYFSNCAVGNCNGPSSGNILQAAFSTNQPVVLTRASDVVTVTQYGQGYGAANGFYQFPVGSTVVVSGFTPSDLNGTFTVLTNTYDYSNASMTWAQTGANEASTNAANPFTGYLSDAPTTIAFYPMAFITGTNGNAGGGEAQLATNTVNWAAGDSVTGAPSAEYGATGVYLVQGQSSPVDGSQKSQGYVVQDDGPQPLTYAFAATNSGGTPSGESGVAAAMMYAAGSYGNYFYFGYRPANNGTILYEQGNEPVSANGKPYNIFFDDTGGGQFGYVPSAATSPYQYFTLNQPLKVSAALTATTLTASSVSTAGCATFSSAGVLSSTGAICGGGGGAGTVTSVAAGTWPSWLTPTVTNATTTPSITVTASAIPNGALANSSTTVNGQTCTLGGSCTVTSGSGTVNSGTAYAPAYYSAAGAAVGGATPFIGLQFDSTAAAPTAATSSEVLGAIGPAAITNTYLATPSTTINGQTCTLGGSCTLSGGSGTPPLSYEYFRAGLSDGGAAFAGAFTRYDNNQPQAGSVAPATSAMGYLLFNASPSAPQYAEVTTSLPPYWTSSGLYLQFYSTLSSGNAVLDVQTACVMPGQVVGSPTFTSATMSTTAVSATANGLVQTALISGIAAPGANGCPTTGMTTPTMLTIRVYADATDSVPVYFTGATMVTGRSQ